MVSDMDPSASVLTRRTSSTGLPRSPGLGPPGRIPTPGVFGEIDDDDDDDNDLEDIEDIETEDADAAVTGSSLTDVGGTTSLATTGILSGGSSSIRSARGGDGRLTSLAEPVDAAEARDPMHPDYGRASQYAGILYGFLRERMEQDLIEYTATFKAVIEGAAGVTLIPGELFVRPGSPLHTYMVTGSHVGDAMMEGLLVGSSGGGGPFASAAAAVTATAAAADLNVTRTMDMDERPDATMTREEAGLMAVVNQIASMIGVAEIVGGDMRTRIASRMETAWQAAQAEVAGMNVEEFSQATERPLLFTAAAVKKEAAGSASPATSVASPASPLPPPPLVAPDWRDALERHYDHIRGMRFGLSHTRLQSTTNPFAPVNPGAGAAGGGGTTRGDAQYTDAGFRAVAEKWGLNSLFMGALGDVVSTARRMAGYFGATRASQATMPRSLSLLSMAKEAGAALGQAVGAYISMRRLAVRAQASGLDAFGQAGGGYGAVRGDHTPITATTIMSRTDYDGYVVGLVEAIGMGSTMRARKITAPPLLSAGDMARSIWYGTV